MCSCASSATCQVVTMTRPTRRLGAFNEIAVSRQARRVPMFEPEIPMHPDPSSIILG